MDGGSHDVSPTREIGKSRKKHSYCRHIDGQGKYVNRLNGAHGKSRNPQTMAGKKMKENTKHSKLNVELVVFGREISFSFR